MAAKIQRNEPCSCGSGKKYKKCCLSSDQGTTPKFVSVSGEGLDAPPESPDNLFDRLRMQPGCAEPGCQRDHGAGNPHENR